MKNDHLITTAQLLPAMSLPAPSLAAYGQSIGRHATSVGMAVLRFALGGGGTLSARASTAGKSASSSALLGLFVLLPATVSVRAEAASPGVGSGVATGGSAAPPTITSAASTGSAPSTSSSAAAGHALGSVLESLKALTWVEWATYVGAAVGAVSVSLLLNAYLRERSHRQRVRGRDGQGGVIAAAAIICLSQIYLTHTPSPLPAPVKRRQWEARQQTLCTAPTA